MRSPLKIPVHKPPAEGQFGAVRKHDTHTGVDLYAEVGTKVYAMESGTVVASMPFTGIAAESPWWLDTNCVMIEGASGVILCGEIETELKAGDFVFEGDLVGTILRVIKKDKGKPLAMLHLELYTPGTKEPVWWKLDEPKPENLVDPTPLVESFYVQ
jgi:murein DD-endopeptidase MepM/ murein hydrolase activator NlpD